MEGQGNTSGKNIFPGHFKGSGIFKGKLSFYDHLQAKYGRTGSEEEKITLRILSQQRGQLRSGLYPNFFERLFQMFMQPLKKAIGAAGYPADR